MFSSEQVINPRVRQKEGKYTIELNNFKIQLSDIQVPNVILDFCTAVPKCMWAKRAAFAYSAINTHKADMSHSGIHSIKTGVGKWTAHEMA